MESLPILFGSVLFPLLSGCCQTHRFFFFFFLSLSLFPSFFAPLFLCFFLHRELMLCDIVAPPAFPCANNNTKKNGHRTSLLQVMVCDPYANYVVQKIIDVADPEESQTIIMEIRAHAAQLKRYTFGKHIISRLEKVSGKKL